MTACCNLCLFSSRPATCCSTRPTVAILQYFDQTYDHGAERRIANTDIVHHIEPTFPPQVWNVPDITVNAGNRTNNYCEAWNRRFETLVGHKSPSVWTALEVLGDDAAEAATMR